MARTLFAQKSVCFWDLKMMAAFVHNLTCKTNFVYYPNTIFNKLQFCFFLVVVADSGLYS